MQTMSECAAQNPARLSLTTSSTALISFFIPASPHVAQRSSVLDQPCDFFREFAQERVELLVLLFTAKRSEEHTSELQSQSNLVCRLLLEKKKNITTIINSL